MRSGCGRGWCVSGCECVLLYILEMGDIVIVRMRLTLIFSGRKVRFMCWVTMVYG